MPKRKIVLTSRHYDILQTIKRLQPCSSGDIARYLNIEIWIVYKMIFQTLYRAGLVDSEIIKTYKGRKMRKPCTIYLTKEGEQLLNGHLSKEST